VSNPPKPRCATRPGFLKEIKQVELFQKYRPLVPKEYWWDECCPEPVKDILDREKERKRTKDKLKRVVKNKINGRLDNQKQKYH
jgi:hypothetical protein